MVLSLMYSGRRVPQTPGQALEVLWMSSIEIRKGLVRSEKGLGVLALYWQSVGSCRHHKLVKFILLYSPPSSERRSSELLENHNRHTKSNSQPSSTDSN